jgi:hypothetical protein
MSVKTSWNSSVPVEVAKGGTGLASTTAYAVLCGGTTSTNPLQSIASVGTANQVLTSNGAGSLPTFQTPGLTLIASTDGSGLSEVTFTNLTSGNYWIVINRYRPATNSTGLIMTVSTDNGSSYSATNYHGSLLYNAYDSTTLSVSSSTTYWPIGVSINNTASFQAAFVFANVSYDYPAITGTCAWRVSGSSNQGRIGSTWATGSVNAIKFAPSSGSITVGFFNLYKINQ